MKNPSAEGVNATIYGVWQKLRSIGATGLRDSCKNLIHVCESAHLGSHNFVTQGVEDKDHLILFRTDENKPFAIDRQKPEGAGFYSEGLSYKEFKV